MVAVSPGRWKTPASVLTSGEMTRAVRDAKTPAGAIKEGDWLGLVDGTVTVISAAGRRFGRAAKKVERWTVGTAPASAVG